MKNLKRFFGYGVALIVLAQCELSGLTSAPCPDGTRRAVLAQSISICLENRYARRDGTWVWRDPQAPQPNLIRAYRVDVAAFLPTLSRGCGGADGYCVRELRVQETQVGGESAVIETGLVSGGIAGIRDVPTVLVRWQESPANWLVLRAEAGDGRFSDVLAIIHTAHVQFRSNGDRE